MVCAVERGTVPSIPFNCPSTVEYTHAAIAVDPDEAPPLPPQLFTSRLVLLASRASSVVSPAHSLAPQPDRSGHAVPTQETRKACPAESVHRPKAPTAAGGPAREMEPQHT
jgi:hypothetical protein